MTHSIPALQPLTFPLKGSHLIEASAGTGKTFTIAALYVRLVLGHGGTQGFGRALTPPDILVVTFTEAATQELRNRIRARLAEAAEYFRADPQQVPHLPPGKDFLYDLRADYPDSEWPACAQQLQLAAEWMDEAAVSTIHAWCKRMLREHAFDSLSVFTQNLETDQSELLGECVRDYWRNHYYGLNAEDARVVLKSWPSPAALQAAVQSLLAAIDLLPLVCEPAEQLTRWRLHKQTELARLKADWPQWCIELQTLLDQAVANRQVNTRKMQSRWYQPWLNQLLAWANDAGQESVNIGTGWQRLTRAGIAEVWTGPPEQIIEHPAFEAIETLPAALQQLPNPEVDLLCHAARWIAQAFQQAQQQRAQMGFDDLLTGLQRALQNPQNAQGERLAELIRRQFPVALIDEFQDTDPLQYDIFQRVYPLQSDFEDASLILIGDPKQAIYAFRGADIYTYLQARQALQNRIFTLDTNYRSSTSMVAAVNHCFLSCEQNLQTSGAFRFRHSDSNPLPFAPVKAHGSSSQFVCQGQTPAALQLNVLDDGELLNKGDYLTPMAAIAASRIVEWLNLGQKGAAGFMQDSTITPLQPSDIAVLVSNAKEARLIRQALSQRNVRSVYLSDQESVYASGQAQEILHWLKACAEPDNDQLLRTALSTPSLGLSFAELEAMNQDELYWESRSLQFKTYQQVWQRQGVLPMLRRLLFDFAVVERLLAAGVNADGISGDRQLTDLLHLAELLQQASHNLEGEHALLRFLAEQLDAPAFNNEAQKVRLESDADLVKVITIHKSKGLEYPLVFLPFISAARPVKAQDKPIHWHDAEARPRLALQASDAELALADEERLAEDLRKLYVALTRARHVTWVGLAPLKADASAVSYLLALQTVKPGDWLSHLQTLMQPQPAIEVVLNPSANQVSYAPPEDLALTLRARQIQRVVREDWRIGSYSQLCNGLHMAGSEMAEDTPLAQNLQETLFEPPLPQLAASAEADSAWQRFPQGAAAGTFLHDLLEWLAQQGFAAVVADSSALREQIARRCQMRDWAHWQETLQDWLLQMLQTPFSLPAGGKALRWQDLRIYQAEMEFWFEAHQADLQQLDALVTAQTLQNRPRPALKTKQLNGLMKGFIDLVFEHEGRYYVADYKSNWLGAKHADYGAEALLQAMCQHRYDVQFVLYLLALHRHLRSRLADYDYDRHVGGALYVFLRGIGAEQGGLYAEKPPKTLIEALDRLFAGQHRSAA